LFLFFKIIDLRQANVHPDVDPNGAPVAHANPDALASPDSRAIAPPDGHPIVRSYRFPVSAADELSDLRAVAGAHGAAHPRADVTAHGFPERCANIAPVQ
jgi:hypothetical protein